MNTLRVWWQARLAAWLARRPATDTLVLTQRNVYILPTRGGWLFALTLLTLLVASINYQLNLGFALTFLLAGSAVASMLETHRSLRGVSLALRAPAPCFAGEAARLEIALQSPGGRDRHGLALRLLSLSEPSAARGALPVWVYADLPSGARTLLHLSVLMPQRGRQALPGVQIESRFPLGLFRAWAVWRPAAQLLVYPSPERPGPALPHLSGHAVPQGQVRRGSGSELVGVRAWQRGDSLRSIAWKQAARSLASGGELIVRDHAAESRGELWLEWSATAGLGTEDRLRRLAHWIVQADGLGLAWGLRLPGHELTPAHGVPQRQRGLESLALWTL